MRPNYRYLLVYFLVACLLFLPERIEKRIAFLIEECKLSFHPTSKKGKKQPVAQSTVASKKELSEEEKLFHLALDDLSPWVLSQVISHQETPWSHTAWINVGKTSEGLPFAIEQNCPVVYGKHVVGVVEQVGEKASLIRLLSDPLLRPSVQVMRHGRDSSLDEAILLLKTKVEQGRGFFQNERHTKAFSQLLSELESSLPSNSELLLAKGELQGALSLRQPTLLRGVGFNYDIADEKGPARDIRTGQVDAKGAKLSLILPGDLLLTTGMDGLYPPGFQAGRVQKVLSLEEGGFAYEIEAIISCPTFLRLSKVAILPALPQEIHEESLDIKALMDQVEKEIADSSSNI